MSDKPWICTNYPCRPGACERCAWPEDNLATALRIDAQHLGGLPSIQQRVVEAADGIERLRAALAAPAVPAPAEPLKGWKLNHVQFKRGEGTAEIGYLDPEDDRFFPIVTVDTGLYYQPEAAVDLARAILEAIESAQPAAQPKAEPILVLRTFDELLDQLVYNARWAPDEVESAKSPLRAMYDGKIAARAQAQPAAQPSAEPVAEVFDTFGNSQDPAKCVGHVYLRPGYFPPRGTKLYEAAQPAAQPSAEPLPLTDEQAISAMWLARSEWMEHAGIDTQGINHDTRHLRAMLPYFRAGERAGAKRAAQPSAEPHHDYPCRTDGRCQYAIDHGAEGLGHCPKGKCAHAEQPLKPLTDEQALAIIKDTPQEDVTQEGWIRRQRLSWVRAIERAHGIGSKP